MVLFNIKKLITLIEKNEITQNQFIIYAIFTFGQIFTLVRSIRLPVTNEGYSFIYVLPLIPIIITIVKLMYSYKTIYKNDMKEFLYTIIPINFVLTLRYSAFIMIPLVVINLILINALSLDYSYWIFINSQIISILLSVIIAVHFITIIKGLQKAK